MVSSRLKDIIFKKLYNDLSQVEIIHYKDEIWFIDRNLKSWYFMYKTFNNMLWWRLQYFNNFFVMFSLTEDEFVTVLSSWVEEVLNHKVDTTEDLYIDLSDEVEEVLNHKVDTTRRTIDRNLMRVREVLNCKVDTTHSVGALRRLQVEEVLKYKVDSTVLGVNLKWSVVEEVLNNEV
jgi:hypothetical protein